MAASPRGNSVLLLRPLATVLTRLGEDGDGFLTTLGISPASTPSTYVAAAKVDRALEEIASRRGDDAFALTMARKAVVRPLGLFGHLVWLSGTMRDALTRAARFYSLVSQRSILSLDAPPGEATATVTRRTHPGAAKGRILVEFTFASLMLRARAASGEKFRALEMRFAHDAHDLAPYESLFQSKVVFNAEVDAMTIDAACLDLPLSTADPLTAAAVEAQATELRARLSLPSSMPFEECVRTAVLAEMAAGSPPSRENVARRLAMSDRSLSRRLRDQELSLREVVTDAQRERAGELMSSGMTIKEVAFVLGFSETSAFSRAYKRWTGRAPSSKRR